MAKKKFGLDSIRGASAAVNGTVTVDTQVNIKEKYRANNKQGD